MGASELAPDGIFGLAVLSYSGFHCQSSLFHILFHERKLSQPMFSLKPTYSGGKLYVCGMNEVLYIHSALVFTPVTNPAVVSANARRYGCILTLPFQGLWEMNLKIDNIQVNGVKVLTDVPAVINTGSHFIIDNPQRVLALYHGAFGGEVYQNGYYTCEF
jgi:hypothetical protein